MSLPEKKKKKYTKVKTQPKVRMPNIRDKETSAVISPRNLIKLSQEEPSDDYFTVRSVRVAQVSNSNDSKALRSIKVKTSSKKRKKRKRKGFNDRQVGTGAGAKRLPIRAFQIMCKWKAERLPNSR